MRAVLKKRVVYLKPNYDSLDLRKFFNPKSVKLKYIDDI